MFSAGISKYILFTYFNFFVIYFFLLPPPPPRVMAEQNERTFIAIKPDGVQRGIIGDVITRFERKGFKLVGMKMLQVSQCFTYHACSLQTFYIPMTDV